MEKAKYQQLSPEEVKKFEEENMTDIEREMSEEKARKFEQREQMSPILIIYRDNDLFEKYVPEIERMFTAQGRRIEVKNFPRGTDKNEIEEWYKENLEKLTGTEIISDQTAGVPYISSEFYKSTQEKGIKRIADLDRLMNPIIERTVLGEEGIEAMSDTAEDQSSRWSKFFAIIMKRILENQERIPDKIYILSDHIVDHVDLAAYTDMTYEERRKDPDVFKRKLKELETTLPEELKKVLIESGVDAEKIIIKSENPSQKEIREEIDKEGNWVLVDRHSSIANVKMANAKNLHLPTGSFYSSASEAGLIDIPQKEFSQKLEEVLDEKFGD